MSTVFAAIDLGSYEMGLKIFEIGHKKGVKELDYVRHRIDLGTETYSSGRISRTHIDELIRILLDYRRIMDSYGVTEYRAYGTSAFRETDAIEVVLDLIRQRTGIKVEVLSNSEQRFLDYKSVALFNSEFTRFIEKSAAIVDIGGGSLQISLFDKDTLVTTQNIRMGVLRLKSTLEHIGVGYKRYDQLVTELVDSQLSIFSKMYLRDRKVQNIILLDDYVSPVLNRQDMSGLGKGYVQGSSFTGYVEHVLDNSSGREVGKNLGISEDNVMLMYIAGLLVKCIISKLGAEVIWAPGATLCDGIAYEYAESHDIFKDPHDFEQDLVACARNISKRYMGSRSRSETLKTISLAIFDAMDGIHGLSRRDRLLLEIAAILHDCGKYVNMTNLGDCSYSIIMSTEIIGLSHLERAIVANVVRYNHELFDYYGDGGFRDGVLDKTVYLRIARLTAILRVANGLDRTHRQKFKDVKVAVKGAELVITVDTQKDITLEKGMFSNRAGFFLDIYGIRPVIRQKRGI